ncbi:hypothetical protein ABBQ32_013806 [Trebouxia sp. C0010 RCD-2024]
MPGVRCNTEVILTANNVFRQNHHQPQLEAESQAVQMFCMFWKDHAECPLLGRNLLLQNVCPQLQGLCMVKLALMLMLVGGEPQVSKNGQSRAELHMLLVGDPGTGKSQLMQYAAKLSPRGVISSGRGSSSAGLTVTAIKDGGQWALEAGALILADGGVCCIDEFDGIKEADKVSIHEVMEQQTLSVAKAGLVTSLSTRTSVFGAMNPRGNPKDSVAEQTLLSGPLLSRFDILLPVHDPKSSEADEVISEHILTNHQLHRSSEPKSWDLMTMQQYLLWVKATFHPELSNEAEEVLTGYYKLQRTAVDRTSSRTTVRMLESLVRSAQAHAKLMARQQVTLQDAVVAVSIAEAASQVLGSGLEFNVGASFCDQPDAAYEDEAQYLLQAIRHLHSDSE